MISTQENISIKPESRRIGVLDAVRGCALLGILLMNIPYFGMHYKMVENIHVLKEYSGPNYLLWWLVNGIFEGSMRGLFSFLFGASSILLLNSLENKKLPSGLTPADVYYRRLIWLLIFGFINAYLLLWPGDILYTYAICGLFIFPFRILNHKQLFAFGALFIVLSTAQATLSEWSRADKRAKGESALSLEKAGKKLSEEEKSQLESWKTYLEERTTESIRAEAEKENKMRKEGYASIFKAMAGVNAYIQTQDFYYELFFDALAFFMIGMGLFKWGYFQFRFSAIEYAGFALMAYLVGIPLSIWYNKVQINCQFDDSLLSAQIPISVYQIKRVSLAFGHLSLLVALYRLGWFSAIFQALAAVGQMAFTNYLMQTILCGLIFNGYGLGLFGELQRYQLYEIVVGVWIFQILFSLLWMRYFKMGPLEWLWRSLTYWQWQSLKYQSS